RRIELERERFLAGGSKGVSAKDGGDDAPIEAEQAVVVDRSDAGEAGADRVFGLGAFRSPITCKGGIVADPEQLDQRASHGGGAAQGIDNGVDREADAHLAQIAVDRAQDRKSTRLNS